VGGGVGGGGGVVGGGWGVGVGGGCSFERYAQGSEDPMSTGASPVWVVGVFVFRWGSGLLWGRPDARYVVWESHGKKRTGTRGGVQSDGCVKGRRSSPVLRGSWRGRSGGMGSKGWGRAVWRMGVDRSGAGRTAGAFTALSRSGGGQGSSPAGTGGSLQGRVEEFLVGREVGLRRPGPGRVCGGRGRRHTAYIGAHGSGYEFACTTRRMHRFEASRSVVRLRRSLRGGVFTRA